MRVYKSQDPSVPKWHNGRCVENPKTPSKKAFQASHREPMLDMFRRLRRPIAAIHDKFVGRRKDQMPPRFEEIGSTVEIGGLIADMSDNLLGDNNIIIGAR